jgi:hypothetical protein
MTYVVAPRHRGRERNRASARILAPNSRSPVARDYEILAQTREFREPLPANAEDRRLLGGGRSLVRTTLWRSNSLLNRENTGNLRDFGL